MISNPDLFRIGYNSNNYNECEYSTDQIDNKYLFAEFDLRHQADNENVIFNALN